MVSLGAVSESEIDPLLRNMQAGYPELQLGIYPQQGSVNVVLSAPSRELLTVAVSELEAGFGEKIFLSQRGTIEDALQALMVQNCETLATAESCTGGTMAQLITSVPGASGYFLGGVVAYSNECKKNFLEVPEELLEQHGAVSEPVVEAMVAGLLERTEADWGVAVSGIAGPGGGTADKPVGTVCAAIARRGGRMESWTHVHFRANREMIVGRSARNILFRLYQIIRAYHQLDGFTDRGRFSS
jgi:nicotinamide-nucleotide amidase